MIVKNGNLAWGKKLIDNYNSDLRYKEDGESLKIIKRLRIGISEKTMKFISKYKVDTVECKECGSGSITNFIAFTNCRKCNYVSFHDLLLNKNDEEVKKDIVSQMIFEEGDNLNIKLTSIDELKDIHTNIISESIINNSEYYLLLKE